MHIPEDWIKIVKEYEHIKACILETAAESVKKIQINNKPGMRRTENKRK